MNHENSTYSLSCAICEESRPERFRIWFDDYLKLYRCLSCGFIAQFPGPGRFTIVTSYQDIYSLDFLKEGKDFRHPYRRRALQDIVNRIVHYLPNGRILDVGCGDGHFLSLCLKKRFDCYGVESSKQLSGFVASRITPNVKQCDYSKKLFTGSFFDIVSFIQVLEHISTPKQVLEDAYYHLRPGGILVIEIPSIQSPHFLAYRLTRLKWFIKSPEGVINSHFGYYSPHSLSKLVSTCGFEQIALTTGRWQYKYSGYLHALGKMLDPVFNALRVGGILYIGRKA